MFFDEIPPLAIRSLLDRPIQHSFHTGQCHNWKEKTYYYRHTAKVIQKLGNETCTTLLQASLLPPHLSDIRHETILVKLPDHPFDGVLSASQPFCNDLR